MQWLESSYTRHVSHSALKTAGPDVLVWFVFVGDAGVATLATALSCWSSLQQLRLQENYSIGTEGMRSLAAAMSSLPALQDLNLSKNQIGQEGARQLALGLEAAAAAALKAAAEVAAGASAEEETAAGALAPHLNTGTGNGSAVATELVPGSKGLQGMNSSSTGAAVQVDFGLQVLELGSCSLRAEGVQHIAVALGRINQAAAAASTAAALEGRASSSGQGGESGAAAVALVKSLKYLGLAKNSIGDRGIKVRMGAWAGGLSYSS
jgi:hypothetical protein